MKQELNLVWSCKKVLSTLLNLQIMLAVNSKVTAIRI